MKHNFIISIIFFMVFFSACTSKPLDEKNVVMQEATVELNKETTPFIQSSEQEKFEYYSQLIVNVDDLMMDVEHNDKFGEYYRQLGDCYAEGIGTEIDTTKACENYLKSALGGDTLGLKKLLTFSEEKSSFFDEIRIDTIVSYKMLSHWRIDPFYRDDLDNDSHKQVTDQMNYYWNNKESAAVKIQENIDYPDVFPKSFVQELVQALYRGSYPDFEELTANRSREDLESISFSTQAMEKYKLDINIEYVDDYYEYDFDGGATRSIVKSYSSDIA